MTLTFGSLFSGIGGIDLGLERTGMQCAWQVEIDGYATQVLQKHWPHVARFRDIRDCGACNLPPVDLVAGGFPCQPHSYAGKRQASADERNLWPEFARIIREIRPRWVLAENVVGLLSSEDGQFFGGVLRDLAQSGYDAQWFCLRASDVGAPHQRERVFIVAYASGIMVRTRPDISRGVGETPASTNRAGVGSICTPATCSGSYVANANSFRETRQESSIATWLSRPAEPAGLCGWENCTPGVGLADAHCQRLQIGRKTAQRTCATVEGCTTGQPQPGMGGMFDGLSRWLDRYQWPAGPGEEQYDWEPPRVTTERQAYRAARLKALGNAVVPQVTEYIGRLIVELHAQQNDEAVS